MLMLLISSISIAQESNNVTILQSPGSYDDGFSFGIQYEYINKTVYVGPELYVFPDLNNMTYIHTIARAGVNVFRFDNFRTYIGGRAGAIFRDGSGHALLGGEIGIDYKFKRYGPSFYIRLSGARDMKTDSKIWGDDSYHTVNSGLIGIGYKF